MGDEADKLDKPSAEQREKIKKLAKARKDAADAFAKEARGVGERLKKAKLDADTAAGLGAAIGGLRGAAKKIQLVFGRLET